MIKLSLSKAIFVIGFMGAIPLIAPYKLDPPMRPTVQFINIFEGSIQRPLCSIKIGNIQKVIGNEIKVILPKTSPLVLAAENCTG